MSMFSSPEDEIEWLRRENKQLQSSYEKLQREQQWFKDLCSNPALDPADKLCLIARFWKSYDVEFIPLNTPIKMNYQNDAKLIGLSPKQMGQHFKKLATNDGASTIVQREVTHTGHGRDMKHHISLALSEEILLHPDKVFLNEPRNKGNNQRYFVCKSCHGTKTVARRVYEVTCMECGSVHVLDASKREDRAFIIDENTAEHFEEWYGNPVLEPEGLDVEALIDISTPIPELGEQEQEQVGFTLFQASPEQNAKREEVAAREFAWNNQKVQARPFPKKPARDCFKCGGDCWKIQNGEWKCGCE